MRNLKLRSELVRLLRRIEDNGLGTSLYGLSHQTATQTLEPEFRDILNNAGLTRTQYLPGQAFSRELVRSFRSKAGKELADALRDALRRWDAYGIRLSVLEDMVLAVLQRYLGTKPGSWRAVEKPRKRRKGTYEDALRQGRARKRAASTIEEQAAAHRKMADISREISNKVRALLNTVGVSTILYPYYLAFGREMWKLTNRINGQSAAKEAAILIAKWVARGLTQSVLESIRYDVFGVSAPAGP